MRLRDGCRKDNGPGFPGPLSLVVKGQPEIDRLDPETGIAVCERGLCWSHKCPAAELRSIDVAINLIAGERNVCEIHKRVSD